jgi:hypothetical protein
MHDMPLGSHHMPNGEWGSGREGGGGEGGEEMYPPPSPNGDKKDNDNDENAGAKHSSTRLLDASTTHHGSARPTPTKHPTTDKRGYLKPTSDKSPALGHAIDCTEPSLTSDKEAATTAGLLKSETHTIETILFRVNLKHYKVCPSNQLSCGMTQYHSNIDYSFN